MNIPSDILKAKILIVDDQEANVALLEHILAGAGYTSVSSTMDARAVFEPTNSLQLFGRHCQERCSRNAYDCQVTRMLAAAGSRL
jgi:CheY-like chemotaxis protein